MNKLKKNQYENRVSKHYTNNHLLFGIRTLRIEIYYRSSAGRNGKNHADDDYSGEG